MLNNVFKLINLLNKDCRLPRQDVKYSWETVLIKNQKGVNSVHSGLSSVFIKLLPLLEICW